MLNSQLFFKDSDVRNHFSPETIVMLCGVFEDAWATVKLRPQDHQATLRTELAEAIMDLQLDPENLKVDALAQLHKSTT